ncbi:dienelactone hydrolase family protein [Leeuwenhoekiella palythoae]|uniref:dienelactone hydrolase family protein n=1 Tax=Leeuwenhoekiella palythoae TaxID=573501 RepID=UPI001CE0A866|nr:dienelactone hydrolase family protein [Leeuwenhoekiella palythoae]UBZ09143.1 dienelactone hydrolase family protein [Leeuwenhoekiella palythoae]
MKKLQKEDIKQEVFDLYDAYAHNKLERREFVERLSMFAVGSITVPALLSFLMPDYETTRRIAADDPNLDSKFITYNSPKGGGEIKALLSKPKNTTEKLGGIVVVHENRGLNPYIEDTARIAALEGFITIAPDALSPLGGYPGNDDDGRAMQRKRDSKEMLEDFIAAYEYLKNHKDCNGNVGVVGFCFGGSISNMMAVKVPTLKASVPFYGGQPTEDIDQIQAPLLLQYAGLDERINAGWPDYEAKLKEHNKEYGMFLYPNVNHGFHNNTTPRYDKEAAELAWERTIAFFKEHLS